VLVALAVVSGCASTGADDSASTAYARPTVAVASFENRAPFPLRWELGHGMAAQLTASLADSPRMDVVDRAALNAVLDELDLQQDPRFRDEGRAEPGRLKNARYLIRGTVVDFTHVAGGGMHFMRGLLRGRFKGYVALVTIVVEVIDVQSREVDSNTFEGTAWAREIELETVYDDVGFGGRAFRKTPLGKATREAIDEAVVWLEERIASELWTPLVARVDGSQIYLNGGADRDLMVGEVLALVSSGEPIVDPATGDVLGRTPTEVVGRLKITAVHDQYAIAELIRGDPPTVGQRCRRIAAPE
jgi:curli biogenesis system outer membrane secretion channel CsgG